MSVERANIFERSFRNTVERLNEVTHEAMQFAEAKGVGPKGLYLLNLAIEELATNILKYGYDDKAVHEIRIRLEAHPENLLMVIEDDGHEFNPLNAPEPDLSLPAEERMPGGLGIHLVRKMVDDCCYQRCDGRNRMTLKICRC